MKKIEMDKSDIIWDKIIVMLFFIREYRKVCVNFKLLMI